MALIHADNFSIYGTNTSLMLNGVYAEVSDCFLVTDPDGISEGHVLQIGGSGLNNALARFVLPSLTDTCGIASRVWFPALPTDDGMNCRPHVFRNVGNSDIVSIRVTNTGRLQVLSGSGTILGETVSPAITANGWYHIETRVVRHASAGTVEIRVEGITVLSLGDLALGSSSIAQVAPYTGEGFGGTEQRYQTKDFVVWDDSGSYNNDFLGSVLVHSLLPTSDTSLNWTPSTGTSGWEILDNIPPNDSTYLSAPYDSGGPPYFPDPYVGALSELPVETTSVRGIITFVRAAKSDGGDGSLQIGIISDPLDSPATALGADRPITVAQTYWRDIFEVDPKTSAPWLPDAVNNAELQINRTS